ncbi:MAG TPA: Gfo/Idh/MocA family oxidoreductase, partial [Bryobacteraceae bacterium]|nr:Gfo/Idh/MocA family oxidoreductase [Bryobacteraceae bacterium]
KTSRRDFLLTPAIAGLAASPLAAQQAAAPVRSANDRIRVALIGAGIMGSEDATSSLAQSGVELVAVADVYEGRLTRAKERWGNQVFTTRDYREVLAKPDIDAVIIATPDHWHAQMSVDAMNAGKDVYVEKPMVQKVEDGKRVVEAQKKTGRMLQVGSQRVSSIVYQKARDLLKAGAIGKINTVEAWWDRNSATGAWQYSIPLDASPQTVDWDRFLGSAPKRPFEPIRLFRWRNYRDYGTGVAGDLFVHLFSGMHYILGSLGPTRVYSTGGIRFWKDGRDVPDIMMALCDYPETENHPAFNLALRVNFVSGGGENSGFRFVGSEGSMSVGSGVTLTKVPREPIPGQTADTFAKAQEEEFLKKYREQYPAPAVNADSIRAVAEERYNPPRNYNDHRDHHRVFINAVRSRKGIIEDSTFGLRAAGPALLSMTSYFEQRAINWDPQTMTVKA